MRRTLPYLKLTLHRRAETRTGDDVKVERGALRAGRPLSHTLEHLVFGGTSDLWSLLAEGPGNGECGDSALYISQLPHLMWLLLVDVYFAKSDIGAHVG